MELSFRFDHIPHPALGEWSLHDVRVSQHVEFGKRPGIAPVDLRPVYQVQKKLDRSQLPLCRWTEEADITLTSMEECKQKNKDYYNTNNKEEAWLRDEEEPPSVTQRTVIDDAKEFRKKFLERKITSPLIPEGEKLEARHLLEAVIQKELAVPVLMEPEELVDRCQTSGLRQKPCTIGV